MGRKIRFLAMVLLGTVFLVSGFFLLRDLERSRREREANRQLASQVQEAEEETVEDGKQPGSEEALEEMHGEDKAKTAKILPKYTGLWEQNNDLAGWISIEDTEIDYAVMYTPKDPEYYLHRGFDREEAASGSLFIGEGWVSEAGNTIIYGHHMRDGTMFGTLDEYKAEGYAEEHPIIRFDTLTEEGEYQVMAAFYSQIYSLKERDVFRYYWYADLRKEERFEEYVEQVKEAALYDTGIDAVYGDELLTLSTCSYHTDEGRFVVVAKKISGEGVYY